MPLDFSSTADAQQMTKIENAVASTLAVFRNDRTEAMLIVFALLRVARIMFRLYPQKTQDTYLPLLVAFVRGETEPPAEARSSSPLWTPQTH